MMLFKIQKAAAVVALALAGPAMAAPIADPAADLIGTYGGSLGGEVDILSASVTRRSTGIDFSVTLADPVGTTPGVLYVWGINRGAGIPRLTFGSPSIGAGINFDGVFVMFGNGDARVVSLPLMGAPTITNLPGALSISGNSISGTAPLSLLPSTGFAVEDYRYSLWSRQRVNPAVDGTNAEIADFLAGSGSITAAVPEPATWAMLLAGFGTVGLIARRRRPVAVRTA